MDFKLKHLDLVIVAVSSLAFAVSIYKFINTLTHHQNNNLTIFALYSLYFLTWSVYGYVSYRRAVKREKSNEEFYNLIREIRSRMRYPEEDL